MAQFSSARLRVGMGCEPWTTSRGSFIDFLFSSRCPDGYIGPRCDYKDLDGSYLGEFRHRKLLEHLLMFWNLSQPVDHESCWRRRVSLAVLSPRCSWCSSWVSSLTSDGIRVRSKTSRRKTRSSSRRRTATPTQPRTWSTDRRTARVAVISHKFITIVN